MTDFIKIHTKKDGMTRLLNISNISIIKEYANDKCVIYCNSTIFEIEIQESFSEIVKKLNIK